LPKERVERDEEDLVRLYLTDIGQYPLLTKDDEVRLAQQIEAGNTARSELEDPNASLSPARKTQLKRRACRSSTSSRRATSA
jgi:DNA-directed RNA polymerase sigma subunit (sigma70/sigma32)